MKKEGSVWTSASGNGVRLIALLLFLCLPSWAVTPEVPKIEKVTLKLTHPGNPEEIAQLKSLVLLKAGSRLNHQKIRKSIENLYKIGSFSDIQVKTEKLETGWINLYFEMTSKFRIKSIKIYTDNSSVGKGEIRKSMFSIRKNDYFDINKVKDSLKEINNLLESHGYFHANIKWEHKTYLATSTSSLIYRIKFGSLSKIRQLKLNFSNQALKERFKDLFSLEYFIPSKLQKQINKARNLLKKEKYYFPEITYKESFLTHQNAGIDLEITIKEGYKYLFNFIGSRNKYSLISTIWEKKRYEKWAEQESKARILHDLQDRGYHNANVTSRIEEVNNIKHINFIVKKNRKYRLGSLRFKGNKAFSARRLREIIKTDDIVFNKVFWLRPGSVLADQNRLKLFYYSQGYPSAKVTLTTALKKHKIDLIFIINEGKKFTVDSMLFDGNDFYSDEELRSFMETQDGGSYVLQQFQRDLETLRNRYYSFGFDRVEINPEIPIGTEKTLLVNIREGKSYKMGTLTIIGASNSQKSLLKKLFPLNKEEFFNRLKVENFRNEVENTSVFSELKIYKIDKEPDLLDILIKVIPDRSRFYGFGIGWEDRGLGEGVLNGFIKGLRGTLEYQERNIFNSYSSLSAILQKGLDETRFVISYDTPYFLRTQMDSSLRIWDEDQIYPSYAFNRIGIGESIIKRLSLNSYVTASLNWYRTDLTELRITPNTIDQENSPFYTTSLNLFYMKENRDDPFNPQKGSFFSSDLKLAFPILEKDYSFFRLLWSYQKNFRLLKSGRFSVSVRNGIALGDMSITERFFAGGPHTFRGVNYFKLGPKDDDTQEPMGGHALVLLNFEATFPLFIIPFEDFYYSVFADFGNIYNKPRDVTLSNLEKAIGISIKYKTPGPFARMDFAWNLREDLGINNIVFHIGIGNVF